MDEADSQPKRRRVTRACDECRRKKIKCDGKSPCTHCCVYEYACTYLQPSNRRRNPPIAYVESLEQRCSRYEKLLRRFMPGATFDTEELEVADSDDIKIRASVSPTSSATLPADGTETRSLESMVGPALELNRDDYGNIDFRGDSSGTLFVKKVYDQVVAKVNAPNSVNEKSSDSGMPDSLDQLLKQSPELNQFESLPQVGDEEEDIVLPKQEVAVELAHLCFDNACVIIQFVHQPTFFERVVAHYANAENEQDDSFSAVLYSAMAVGCLFAQPMMKQLGIDDLKLRAFQYFQASKRFVDPLDRANTEILQSLLLQMLFLHSTANISACWTYLGTAMRCAQRIGIHRKFDDETFNPLESQLRRKMFWTIRNLEMYLHAILGLPRSISDCDYDQHMPEEVDDDYVTANGILQQPADTLTNMISVNAYGRLMTIMGNVIRNVYPLNTSPYAAETGKVLVSHKDLESLQTALDSWQQSLPPILRHTTQFDEMDTHWYRQSRLLHYSYCYTYITIYRPFLHYVSTSEDQENPSFRQYGQRAKQGAFEILRLTQEIFDNDSTCFGHMISIYSTFFSGMILIYSLIREHTKQDPADRQKCLESIEIALSAMEFSSKCSLAAERCRNIFLEVKKLIPDSSTQIPHVTCSNQKNYKAEREQFVVKQESSSQNSNPQVKMKNKNASKISNAYTEAKRVDAPNAASIYSDGNTTSGHVNNDAFPQGVDFPIASFDPSGSAYSFYPTLPNNMPFQYMSFAPSAAHLPTQDTYQLHAHRNHINEPYYPPNFMANNATQFMPVPSSHEFADYSQLVPQEQDREMSEQSHAAWPQAYSSHVHGVAHNPMDSHAAWADGMIPENFATDHHPI